MRKLTTALALIFIAGTASAEVFDTSDMHMGRTMLETQISNAFKQYGIEQDLTLLSLSQIAQIEGVLSASDKDSGGNNVKADVEAIIRNN